MARRRTVACTTSSVLLLVLAGLTTSVPADADGQEPTAPARYNGDFLWGGGSLSSTVDIPIGAALTEHGAFRAWQNQDVYVRSTAEGSYARPAHPWATATVTLKRPAGIALDGSAHGDYLALVSGFMADQSRPAFDVQTVIAGADGASHPVQVGLPGRAWSTTPVVAATVAAEDDTVDVVVSASTSTPGEAALWWVQSKDRGANWADPVDLTGILGHSTTQGPPRVRLVADGARVALAVTEVGGTPGRYDRTIVLHSVDDGATWTDLGDPVPAAGIHSAAGIGWTVDGLRAAWTSRADAGAPVALASSTAADDASSWTAPATLPSADLNDSPTVHGTSVDPLSVAPMVHVLGPTVAVQALGGHLRTLWPEGWLRADLFGDNAPPVAMEGDRFFDDTFAYFPDTAPPSVTPESGFPRYQGPQDSPSVDVSDDGLLHSLSCAVDGVPDTRASSTYPHCYVRNAVLPEGPHTLHLAATDAAGNTTDRSWSWTTDKTGPVVRWTFRPGKWTLSRTVRWAWSTSDALSGVRSQEASVDSSDYEGASGPFRSTSSSASEDMLTGVSACAFIAAFDHVDNLSNSSRSCTTAPTDDHDLSGSRGLRFRGGKPYYDRTATELHTMGSDLHLRVVSWRRTRDVALRVRTCPTCGKVRVDAGSQSFTVSLRRPTNRLRTIDLPFTGAPKGIRVKVTKVGRGLVLVDGVFLMTTGD